MKWDWTVRWLGIVMLAAACTPPSVVGPALQPVSTKDAFGSAQCSSLRPPTEPDLMAWDPGSRANLAALRKQGVAVVHYEGSGCNASLEVLSNCVAPGGYQYVPYWESDHKVAHNTGELHGKLPVGASSFEARLEGNKALRTDYMLVGIAQIPIGTNYALGALRGDCSRATHVVSRIFMGGFAMAAGEARSLEASASLFASVGASSDASVERFQPAGDAKSCEQARDTQQEQAGCSVPLRLTLLPLAQSRACLEANECSARCDEGDTGACIKLGDMALSGEGSRKNPKQAFAAFKKACDRGDALGCGWLGQLYFFGDGTQQNYDLAAELSDPACAAGNWPSCSIMGSIYEAGRGVRPDPTRAMDYFMRACQGGGTDSCAHVEPLLKQACQKDDSRACMSLGGMYIDGMGVAQDAAQALTWFERACRLRSTPACIQVATMNVQGVGMTRDVPKGLAQLKNLCDAGEAMGCTSLGAAYLLGSAVGEDDAKAFKLLDHACTLGDPTGCAYLGDLYEDGKGVGKDLHQAFELYQSACDRGAAVGCAGLGGLYEDGSGVTKNTGRALALYQQACGGGYADACPAAQRLATDQQ